MKIYWVLFLFIALASKAQSVKDYESAMKKFQKLYNAGKGDSINAMFWRNPEVHMDDRPLWNDIDIKSWIKEYGFLKSFKFLGVDTTDPENVYVFETKFSKKGTNMTSLTLIGKKQLGTFRFITIPDDPKGIKKPAH
jgi:hypothetical protein